MFSTFEIVAISVFCCVIIFALAVAMDKAAPFEQDRLRKSNNIIGIPYSGNNYSKNLQSKLNNTHLNKEFCNIDDDDDDNDD